MRLLLSILAHGLFAQEQEICPLFGTSVSQAAPLSLIQKRSDRSLQHQAAFANVADYEHPQWLSSCKRIYLDVGSNIGVQIRKFFEPEKYPGAPVLPLFDEQFGPASERKLLGNVSGFCALGLEPSPSLRHRLRKLASAYQKRGWNVYFYPFAAFTRDDELSFQAQDGVGTETASHLSQENNLDLPEGYGTKHGVTKVRAIDLASFIKSLPMSSIRLLKLDIEGAEFSVIPHLAEASILCNASIPKAFIEVHPTTNLSKTEGETKIKSFLSAAANLCEPTELISLDDESFAKDVDESFMALSDVGDGVELMKLSPDDGNSYMFGYFDKKQVDDKNEKAIACQIPFFEREPDMDSKMIVGHVPLDGSGKFVAVGETTAWNLQQGSMAEWSGPSTIMFNTRTSNSGRSAFHAKAVDIDTLEEHVYPYPVYAFSRAQDFYVSLNFSRLHLLRRGYGYTVPLQAPADKCPDDDGIWKVDLATNKSELLVSIREARDQILSSGVVDSFTGLQYSGDAESHRHDYWWVNHAHISADGKQIAFLVRANPEALTDTYKFSTLMMLDISSKSLWRVPRPGSHHFFGTVLVSCDPDGTYEVQWQKSVVQLPWQKGTDGHCSLSPSSSDLGENWILTDTYPDKDGMKQLMVEELHGERKFRLGSYKARESGPTEARCDLHPRWDATGQHILFDSTHATASDGRTLRAIYRVNAFPRLPDGKTL